MNKKHTLTTTTKEITVEDLAQVSGGGIQWEEYKDENTFGRTAERSLTIGKGTGDGGTDDLTL